MKRLKTLLGYYIPTFFEMQVDSTDDNMVISKMSNTDATILFHEYVHFLQDFTTYYGLNNLYVQSEYIHSVVNRIYKNGKQFVVPFKINDNDDNLLLNQQICKLTAGDTEEASVYSINEIMEITDDLIKNPHINDIQSIVLNPNGDFRSFGALAIMESMAYIMERLCSPTSVQYSPDYPYRAAELVTQYYNKEFGNDLFKVLALCDVSLLNSNPGVCFINIAKKISSGELVINNAEELYDWYYNQPCSITHSSPSIFRQVFENLLSQVCQLLHSYIHDVPEQDAYHEWINHLINFAKDWRTNDKYFLLKMARQGDLKRNDCWGYTISRVGSPLMRNRLNHYFKLPYEGMKEGEDNVEIFNAIKEIYKLFSEGKKDCEMLKWCCNSPKSTPNELCKIAPWKKCNEDPLCPYAFLWKHWNLKTYEPI